MEHIYIANPKGGCGKTTIAASLAGFCAKQGFKVLVVDHDPQSSCSDWLASRNQGLPNIQIQKPGPALQVAPTVDYIIHDMPAAWVLGLEQGRIKPGDKVIVPVLPSPTDIKACMRFIMALYRSGVLEIGVEVGLVGNRMRSNTHYCDVLMDFLQKLELPFVTSLRDSQNYVKAMAKGLSIFDLPPSRVEVDVFQWQPLLGWLNLLPNAEMTA